MYDNKIFDNKFYVSYLSKIFYLFVYNNAPIISLTPININYFIDWSLAPGNWLKNNLIFSDTHF